MRFYLFIALFLVALAAVIPDLLQRTLSVLQAQNQDQTAISKSNAYGIRLKENSQNQYVVPVRINSYRTQALIDTGANTTAIPATIARKAGIRLSHHMFTSQATTAGGQVKTAQVRLRKLEVGHLSIQGADAIVIEEGKLKTVLLGMTALKRLGKLTIEDGELILKGND
ncbi:retropepsin-like aspartic protease family protein [Polycladidibacter stylochi]|uniref:retropepsin-like aspartic protease family protein n=1 Tax=Polycladidibacter stylochi TaxID=1807766 RepID=UPI000829EAB8|nr:TIGR02281 family clan AA aspartic protease [Pseudovibrio stylochi]